MGEQGAGHAQGIQPRLWLYVVVPPKNGRIERGVLAQDELVGPVNALQHLGYLWLGVPHSRCIVKLQAQANRLKLRATYVMLRRNLAQAELPTVERLEVRCHYLGHLFSKVGWFVARTAYGHAVSSQQAAALS
jgi:hypothetical protein